MATSNNSSVTLIARGNIRPNTIAVGGGKGGVSNYELLTHKPSINGHELMGNKTNADLGIPTDTQDLTNTAGFITKIVDDLVNYYTKLEIDDIINQIKQTSFRIVDDLPLVGDPGVIYLILNSTPQSRNYYDEYIYVDNRWEKIGTTEIDLSDYVTDEELTQVLRNYITNETLNETLRNYYNKADINLLLAGKANSADLATVATSGSYDDLSNKPAIPDELADLSEDSAHRVVTDAEKQTWNNKSDFSGSYNDLINKPTLGTASSYDVPESGNAGTSQVVKGNDSRLSDARTPLSHTHSKADITDFPTNVSAFNNDSGFITNTVNNLANYYLKTQIYTQTEVDNLISAAVNGRFQKVNELPASGEPNVIYLVPKTIPETSNACDEYIWQDNAWELIGSTEIDLSDYVTDDDLTTALQNYLTTSAFNTAIASYYTKTETDNLLANKVDKVAGKGLSTNDYDNTAKGIVDGVTSALNDKVDKVQGKGLSTNDYDNTAKGIVDGVTSALADKVDKINGKGLSTNDYTTADKNKLAGIAANATKVESSETNGNIKIDTVETVVYDDSEIQEAIDTSSTETDYANPLTLETMQAQTAKNTKIKIDPIQDLHGYSKPWVGGAGKNKLGMTVDEIKSLNGGASSWSNNKKTISNCEVTILTDSENNVTGIKITGTPNSNLFCHLHNIATTELSGDYILSGCPSDGGNSTYNITVFDQVTALRDTGSSISFSTSTFANTIDTFIRIESGYVLPSGGLIFYPMIRLASVSDSTFEPYTNICPISGHDQIDILGCGKNFVDYEKLYDVNNVSHIIEGNKITITGKNARRTVRYYATAHNDGIFKKAESAFYVTLSCNLLSVSSNIVRMFFGLRIRKVDGTYRYPAIGNLSIGLKQVTTLIEVGEQIECIDINLNDQATETDDLTLVLENIQLEYGQNVTEYEPYQESNNLSIDLPSTVYGGVLDLESGEVVVDRANYIYNGTEDWLESQSWGKTNTAVYYCDNLSLAKITGQNEINTMFNMFVAKSRNYMYENDDTCAGFTGEKATTVRILRSIASDLSAFKSYLSSNNLTIIYPLATPTILHLTPHQLSLLKAQNNIATSQYTQVKVTYRNGVFATLEPVSEDNDGLMSRLDKVKLDSIADDATKTESSTTNGNIKINGTETQVYDDSEIKGELTTDTTTIEGNPLNFTTLSAQTAKSTILSCEPIQDLHGYDKPWVGGAGKNLLPLTVSNIKALNTAGTWNDLVYTYLTTTFTLLVDSDNNVLGIKINGTPTNNINFFLWNPISLTSGSSYYLSGCPDGGSSTTYMLRFYNSTTTASKLVVGSGDVLISDWADQYNRCEIRLTTGVQYNNIVFTPMIRLSTESDSSFAPYENICPITGRSEIGILGCGKNLCGIPIVEGKAIDIAGNLVNNASRCATEEYIEVETSEKYSLSNSNLMKTGIYCYDKNKTYIGRIDGEGFLEMPKTFNTLNNTKYVRLSFESTPAPSNVQLEKGNQATPYEPYTKSNNLTISFGQTVYGGTLDVENGVLVVDRVIVDLGSLTWELTTGSRFISRNEMPNVLIDSNYKTKRNAICSQYIWVDGATLFNNNVYGYSYYIENDQNRLFIKDLRYSSASDFKDAMDGVQLCYELATPITINLTPNTINLLKGVNNISTDGDKITLTYRDGSVATLEDVKLASEDLEKQIADAQILTDTVTGDKYILVVSNGVLSVEQISN